MYTTYCGHYSPIAMKALLLFLPVLRLSLGSDAARQWLPYTITLNSTQRYGNPYWDVEVNVTFTPTTINRTTANRLPERFRQPMTLPAFWDGDDTWRVRFAAPVDGVWTWTSICNNTQDAGLHHQQGNVTMVLSNAMPFLEGNTSLRYIADVTSKPFFWLGDTHWSGLSSAEHVLDNNDPQQTGNISMFEEMLQVRQQQGYTVWKAESFANNDESGNAAVNEGGAAWVNHTFWQLPNVKFWQAVDRRVAAVNRAGLVASLAVGIGRSMTEPSQLDVHMKLSKYFFARYASYNTVWVTCQEYCARNAYAQGWADIAATVWSLDPYKRPNSMHNCATNPIAYHDQPWYSFVTLQLGHDKVVPVNHWLAQYNATPARPILEDEANYEHIINHYGGGTPAMTRQAAWQAIVGGAFGFTYGAQGIWWACWNASYVNDNCGQNGSPEYKTWHEALRFQVGAVQMGVLKAFWTLLPWWAMGPSDDVITWSRLAPTGPQRPYQKATPMRDVIAAYLPLSYCGSYNGTVHLPTSMTHRYNMYWFNVSDGTYISIAQDVLGNVSIPEQPSNNDWVLLITNRQAIISNITTLPLQTIATSRSMITSIVSLGNTRTGPTSVGLNVTFSKPMTVTALGRYKQTGNHECHVMHLYQTDPLAVVATAYVNMERETDELGFVYGQIDPIIMQPGRAYYVIDVDQDDVFTDDVGTQLMTLPDVNITSSLYGHNDVFQAGGGGKGSSYGPVNLILAIHE
eukprot:TRINITY_DN11056_c0_g1_i3.p1 TRINITY_DN11056_c0_g1~~TRINITY_DN11056_c0_g1_i3.p1  ORF type:complete len:741 (+),score=132.12 TRINITY_DN11056_c0_g1_i3:1656-3878(+)